MTPAQSLTCAVCGSGCKGRQWFNRDRGYGLCPDCADWLKGRESPESMRSAYGDPGVHYFTNNPQDK